MFFACDSSKEKSSQVKTYVVQLEEASNADFYTMFDSITYLPLQTVKGNEIGRVGRILYEQEKFFVLDDLAQCVYIFRVDGQYDCKIDAIGNGVGEYVRITDLAIDPIGQQVKIWDGMQMKIVSYDMEGHFVKETKFPVSSTPLHICLLDSCHFAFDFQRGSSDKQWMYHLIISDEAFSKPKECFLPYDRPVSVSFSPRVTLQKFSDEIIYIPLYSSTLYTIDSVGITPRYAFDFGDHWIDSDYMNKTWSDPLAFRNGLGKTDFVYFFNSLESESHIYAEFMYKENKFHLLVDKHTDHLLLQRETEAYACHYSEIPMCTIGNHFVIPLTPDEYNKQLLSDSLHVKDEDNPVLMVASFKQF